MNDNGPLIDPMKGVDLSIDSYGDDDEIEVEDGAEGFSELMAKELKKVNPANLEMNQQPD